MRYLSAIPPGTEFWTFDNRQGYRSKVQIFKHEQMRAEHWEPLGGAYPPMNHAVVPQWFMDALDRFDAAANDVDTSL